MNEELTKEPTLCPKCGGSLPSPGTTRSRHYLEAADGLDAIEKARKLKGLPE
jgi:transposase